MRVVSIIMCFRFLVNSAVAKKLYDLFCYENARLDCGVFY